MNLSERQARETVAVEAVAAALYEWEQGGSTWPACPAPLRYGYREQARYLLRNGRSRDALRQFFAAERRAERQAARRRHRDGR